MAVERDRVRTQATAETFPPEIQIEDENLKYAERCTRLIVVLFKMGSLSDVRRFATSTDDIVGALLRLQQNRETLLKLEIDTYPCRIFGDQAVPLDWIQVSGELCAANPKGFLALREPWFRVESFRSLWGHDLEELPFEDVLETLKAGLKKIFALRHALLNSPPNAKCGEGVDLTIETDTSDLVIEYTIPLHESWQHFGSPTHPVRKCLPVSNYRFRALEYQTGQPTERYCDRNPRWIYSPVQKEHLPV